MPFKEAFMATTSGPSTTPPFMGHTSSMLAKHPQPNGSLGGELLACIQACFDCAQACSACADACLAEASPGEMVRCIRLDLDCADVCEATGKVLTRQTAFDATVARAVVHACAIACALCADECSKHAARMAHCRVCLEACRACRSACEALLLKAAKA